jgi:TolB-like protein/Tfp pilus assembly protein PilF
LDTTGIDGYEFGPFFLDRNGTALRISGEVLGLPPKSLELLLFLLERAGSVVSQEEIIERVWPDVSVEYSNLTKNVALIRKILRPHFETDPIRTYSKRGYQFVAEVRVAAEPQAGRHSRGVPQPRQSHHLTEKPSRQPGESTLDSERPSVAVLPLANMSGDKEQEYFSDGLTEEIINALAQIPGLKVIARTSAFVFKGQNVDIRKIAETLGVTNIVEGSVRRSGNRLRVTAQLIAAADGTHLWSKRFDREVADVFEVQSEISTAITAELQSKLVAAPAWPHYVPKFAAYEAVLRARYHRLRFTPESMAKARALLEEAIAIDPNYAIPHAELASSYRESALFQIMPVEEAMLKLRAAAHRALALEPSLPEALMSLSMMAFYDFDWQEADRLIRLAMAREPVSPQVRNDYARLLFLTGREREAVVQETCAVKEDPLNLHIRTNLAFMQIPLDEQAAEREYQRVLELEPNYHIAHQHLSWLYVQCGRFQEALTWSEKAFAQVPRLTWVRGQYAALLRLTGDAVRAENVLRELGDGNARGAAFGYAFYHLWNSDFEEAADWAERAIVQRDFALLYVLPFRFAEGLRRSSRWPKIAKMLNLPEASS